MIVRWFAILLFLVSEIGNKTLVNLGIGLTILKRVLVA